MSSGNDVRRTDAEQLQLDAGTQALLSVRTIDNPVDMLPPAADENLLVVSAEPPAEIERRLVDRGVDVSTVGLVPISGSPIEYDGPLATCDRIVPDDLTGLSMRFSTGMDALAPGRGWILVDSLDVLLLYADDDRVFRFLDHVASQARENDVRGVYAIVLDAIDDQVYSNLLRGIDREIDAR